MLINVLDFLTNRFIIVTADRLRRRRVNRLLMTTSCSLRFSYPSFRRQYWICKDTLDF